MGGGGHYLRQGALPRNSIRSMTRLKKKSGKPARTETTSMPVVGASAVTRMKIRCTACPSFRKATRCVVLAMAFGDHTSDTFNQRNNPRPIHRCCKATRPNITPTSRATASNANLATHRRHATASKPTKNNVTTQASSKQSIRIHASTPNAPRNTPANTSQHAWIHAQYCPSENKTAPPPPFLSKAPAHRLW